MIGIEHMFREKKKKETYLLKNKHFIFFRKVVTFLLCDFFLRSRENLRLCIEHLVFTPASELSASLPPIQLISVTNAITKHGKSFRRAFSKDTTTQPL